MINQTEDGHILIGFNGGGLRLYRFGAGCHRMSLVQTWQDREWDFDQPPPTILTPKGCRRQLLVCRNQPTSVSLMEINGRHLDRLVDFPVFGLSAVRSPQSDNIDPLRRR